VGVVLKRVAARILGEAKAGELAKGFQGGEKGPPTTENTARGSPTQRWKGEGTHKNFCEKEVAKFREGKGKDIPIVRKN